MPTKAQILVVEDDEAISTGLAMNLRLEGYDVEIAEDGVIATRKLAETKRDLILLDISMPRKDGLELLLELRNGGDKTPVVVLSARDGEYDKVAALRLGADDYVTKPFALAELMARVHAVLRRAGQVEAPTTDLHHFGDVELNLGTRAVTRDGDEVKLTHLEFELLRFFVGNPTRVFSRQELLAAVWGSEAGSQRTVDNFVGQLRGKLEQDVESPRHFVTVRGSGYRFDP